MNNHRRLILVLFVFVLCIAFGCAHTKTQTSTAAGGNTSAPDWVEWVEQEHLTEFKEGDTYYMGAVAYCKGVKNRALAIGTAKNRAVAKLARIAKRNFTTTSGYKTKAWTDRDNNIVYARAYIETALLNDSAQVALQKQQRDEQKQLQQDVREISKNTKDSGTVMKELPKTYTKPSIKEEYIKPEPEPENLEQSNESSSIIVQPQYVLKISNPNDKRVQEITNYFNKLAEKYQLSKVFVNNIGENLIVTAFVSGQKGPIVTSGDFGKIKNDLVEKLAKIQLVGKQSEKNTYGEWDIAKSRDGYIATRTILLPGGSSVKLTGHGKNPDEAAKNALKSIQ